MRRLGWKKILILIWACALAFGIGYQVQEAEAAHTTCGEMCNRMCKTSGGCDGYTGTSCNCSYICADGTTNTSICML